MTKAVRELDKLNEELALAEIGERDARIDELDVQAAVSFGEFLLLNGPRLWTEATLDQKQRLQQVFFPRGVWFRDDAFGTAETSIIFSEIGDIPPEKEELVAPQGFEPR